MFWRRGRKTSDDAPAAAGDGDMDLAKLQRQFGIKTVSDKDVEAEFLQLLGGNKSSAGGSAMGSALGLSPRSELALFGGGGGDSDEEAQILRQLNLSGDLDSIDVDALSGGEDEGDDDTDGGAGARLAKRELRGVLDEVHSDAKRNAVRNDPLAKPASPQGVAEVPIRERIHTLKLRAVALKRKGNTQEALAVFRELKMLEAQLAGGGDGARSSTATAVVVATTKTSTTTTATASTTRSSGSSVVTHQQRVAQTVSPVGHGDEADEQEVDVTEEDMENPEYLAQLAALGFPVVAKQAKPVETVESLERAIRETKQRAVELKRNDRIPEALAEMRTIKELEVKLATLQASAPPAPVHASASLPVVAVSAAPPVVAAVQITTVLPDTANDSDVEVTDEDMNDPAFAAELQKMGFDPTTPMSGSDGGGDGDQNGAKHPEDVRTIPPASTKALSYVNRYSSMDDSDLIDEFEDDDEDDEPEGKGEPDAPSAPSPPAEATSNEDEMKTEAPAVDALGSLAPVVTEEAAPLEIREPSNESSIEELLVQLEKTKHSAVQLKRQGNVQAALDMMRRMKQIENLIEMKRRQAPVTPIISSEELERKRKFGELEAVLVQFANEATREAKEQLSADRAKAAEWLTKRKEYSAHLSTLREKREVPGQDPPSYRVEKITEQVEVEHTDVPLDEVHMKIESVNEFGQAAGKDVFVKFNLSFPSSAPHEGKTTTFRIPSAPPCSGRVTSENAFRVKVLRGRGTQRLFEIKKAVFEVWRPGSLLRNPEFIARGYQELAPLLTTSELKSRVVFVGSNRKPVGGDVEISLRLRTPLRDKEYRTLVTEIIRVGEYPPPQAPVAVQQAPSRPAARSEPVAPTTAASTRPHSQSEVSARVPTTHTEATKSSTVSRVVSAPPPPPIRAPAAPHEPDASTLEDPHDLDLIISYDVINDEIQRIEAALPNLQGDVAAEYGDRLDSLGLKKQLLEIDMQTGKLTLDSYVARLKQRILDDRAIIKRLMKSGRKSDAARVLHRVKVMEKELEGAEEQEQEEQEGAEE